MWRTKLHQPWAAGSLQVIHLQSYKEVLVGLERNLPSKDHSQGVSESWCVSSTENQIFIYIDRCLSAPQQSQQSFAFTTPLCLKVVSKSFASLCRDFESNHHGISHTWNCLLDLHKHASKMPEYDQMHFQDLGKFPGPMQLKRSFIRQKASEWQFLTIAWLQLGERGFPDSMHLLEPQCWVYCSLWLPHGQMPEQSHPAKGCPPARLGYSRAAVLGHGLLYTQKHTRWCVRRPAVARQLLSVFQPPFSPVWISFSC